MLFNPRPMGASQTFQRPQQQQPQNAAFAQPTAQAPGASRFGNVMNTLLDPQVALPMAAALMGNQGNTANFGNAFAAAGPSLQKRKELEAQTAQKNQTIEFLRQNAPEYAQAVEAGMPVGDAWKAYTQQREVQKPTDTMRNLEWRATNAGLQPGTPEYADFMRAGGSKDGVTVNVGDGSPGLGKLSADYGYVLDPETRQPRIDPQTGLPQAAPVPGSPAAQEIESAERKREGRQAEALRAGSTVLREVGRSFEFLPQIAQGEGIVGASARRALASVPGTAEYKMQEQISSALANVGLDRLQQMRENSPTGGALGQVPFQQQKRLEQVLGGFDITQPPEILEENLRYLHNAYMDISYGSPEERERLVQEGKLNAEENRRINEAYYPLDWDQFGRRAGSQRGNDDIDALVDQYAD